MLPAPQRRAALLALSSALVLAACGGEETPASKGAGGGSKSAPVTLGSKFPEYTPSGIKDDYKRFSELSEAAKKAKTAEERTVNEKALADLKVELVAKWSGKEVPAPEALHYAKILKESEKWPEAATQARRFLEVAPADSSNVSNAVALLVHCLSASGDFDGASAEIEKAKDTVYKNRDLELIQVQTVIAMHMYKGGDLERAARFFETIMSFSSGDAESVLYAVDCWLRLGRVDEAVRVAQRGLDFFKEGRSNTRMKNLVQAVSLVGKPAPDFSAVRDWKGEGGPITRDMMTGRVTVVFSWNMQIQWMQYLFKRVNALNDELAPRGLQLVGISRLAHFDANKMATLKDMTEEKELEFYDAWARQYEVHFALAVGNYDPDTALMDAWAGHAVPSFVVVGKDGKVCYIRSGKEDEHIAILKKEVEKALAK